MHACHVRMYVGMHAACMHARVYIYIIYTYIKYTYVCMHVNGDREGMKKEREPTRCSGIERERERETHTHTHKANASRHTFVSNYF